MQEAPNYTTSIKPANFHNTDEIDLRALLSSILREKKLLLVCIFTCFLLSLGYLFFKTPRYQSNFIIQVQDRQNSLGSSLSQDIANMAGSSSQISAVDVQKSLMTSRVILEPTIQKLGLDVIVQPHYFPILNWFFASKQSQTLIKPRFGTKHYAWGGEQVVITELKVPHNYEKTARKIKLVAGTDEHYQLYDADGQLLLEGKIGQVAKTNDAKLPAISIKIEKLLANPGTEFFITKLPRGKILNKLANAMVINDLGTSRGANNTGILQISLTDTNPQRAVNVLNAIAKVLVQKDIERKSEEAEKTYVFLENQLPISKQALDKAETKLNQYRAKSGKIDLKIESQLLLNQFSTIEQTITQLKLQKTQMLQDYTAKHPFIISMNDKIKGLEEELYQLQLQLKKLPASDQIAVSLMRDVDVKNQLYLLLINKLQEVKVLKAGTISDVRILDLAEYPDEPISSKSFLILSVSILLGLMLGVGIILLRKALIQHVEDPYWIEQHLNISNLAIVPHSKIQDNNVKAFANGTQSYMPILAHTEAGELSIESMRSLRTSVQFLLPTAANNIISIMGISPGVGKSFVSVNFSYVLADIGKRILLIDADIRKGHIHDYFSCKRTPGLTEILTDKISFAEAVIKTQHKDLHFLPSGTFPKNPSELLMHSKFKELLAEVSKLYDTVIIDNSPILAVTDSVLVAKQAGINLLVLSAGEHNKKEIEIAVKRLANNGIKPDGAIFNNKREQTYVYGDIRYHYSYT